MDSSAARAARRRHPGRTARPRRRAQRRPAASTASSCSCRCRKQIDEAAVIDAVDAAQGRGRLRPREPRPADRRPAALPALHARSASSSCSIRNGIAIERQARRHRRPQQHRRQAAGADADAEGAGATPPSPSATAARRDVGAITRQADIVVVAIGQAQLPDGRHGQARRGGDRRRHEPRCRRRQAGAATWTSTACQRGRVGDHAGARRRRADDDHHAAVQHAPGRAPAPRGVSS